MSVWASETNNEDKVAAIQNAKPPQGTAELRSFLGQVQYFYKFLTNFGQVSEPSESSQEKINSFYKGMPAAVLPQVERSVNPSRNTSCFKTHTDAHAGPTSIGAVLTQLQDDLPLGEGDDFLCVKKPN